VTGEGVFPGGSQQPVVECSADILPVNVAFCNYTDEGSQGNTCAATVIGTCVHVSGSPTKHYRWVVFSLDVPTP
jgi:hypothetical protein